MEKSIEQIWKEGFIGNTELVIPQINSLYSQKSTYIIEKLFNSFKMELYVLLILAVVIPIVMMFSHINFWWSITPSLFCLVWFFISKEHLQSLRSINFNTNCYEYLKSIDLKIKAINKINRRNTIISVGFLLSPMVIYTYFNNQDKNLGDILGIDYIDLPNELLFLIIPLTMLAVIPFHHIIPKADNSIEKKIEQLIKSMEELCNRT
ncbi:hypothetical protein [Aquimarina sp. 2201CG5-10]|uniref:hypothetical protein n=1 Tax=Aquimarina callyspongiae TaxID=3098150 RepID=UPI002AB4AB6E|nr:hypothetical protein [Aquimarina sp. 2201CG5-10]MDY8134334.1 hypothetical protein [Aquimarina sp. 2201CG5-10]